MRTTRPRNSQSSRGSASQVMLTDRRSGPARTIVALGVIVASFGVAAFGVMIAASSFVG